MKFGDVTGVSIRQTHENAGIAEVSFKDGSFCRINYAGNGSACIVDSSGKVILAFTWKGKLEN